jgi:hypothetical protein
LVLLHVEWSGHGPAAAAAAAAAAAEDEAGGVNPVVAIKMRVGMRSRAMPVSVSVTYITMRRTQPCFA